MVFASNLVSFILYMLIQKSENGFAVRHNCVSDKCNQFDNMRTIMLYYVINKIFSLQINFCRKRPKFIKKIEQHYNLKK